MIQPRKLHHYVQLAWWLLWHQRWSLLIATGLCIVSLPVNDTLTGLLLPRDLVNVLGILLSLFLGFRYNQAYKRWWEARILWGALVSESRNWRDALTALLPRSAPAALHTKLLQLEVLLIWCVNAKLRSSEDNLQIPAAVETLAREVGFNQPGVLQVQLQMSRCQRELVEEQWLTPIDRRELVRVQQQLSDAIGGLERIDQQPLPASSTFCIRALSWSYGYLVFLKLDASGDLSAAVVGWLAFLVLLMAERLGTFLENPFRDQCFALPLDRLCRLITAELLGAQHPLAHQATGPHPGPVIT